MLKELFNTRLEFSGKAQYSVIVTLFYAVITAILCAHHEMWRDELNTWLAVRDLSLSELLKFISWDGHPFLHYLLCLPLARAGFSAAAMQILCWMFCTAAVFALNFFSPFPATANLIITFSPPMLYYFPVIARNYSYIPLLMFAFPAVCSYLFRNKEINSRIYRIQILSVCILAALIAGTHAIMFGYAFAALLLVYYKLYKDKTLNGANLLSATGSSIIILLTALQLLICRLNNGVLNNNGTHSLSGFIPILNSFFTDSFSDLIIKPVFENTALCCVILCIVFFIYMLGRAGRRYLLLVFISLFVQSVIYYSSYSIILPARTFTILLIFVSAYWTACAEKNISADKKTILPVIILFILSVPAGYNIILKDLKNPFSSAQEMALFIRNNIPDNDDTVLIAPYTNYSQALAYYLGNRKAYYDCGKKLGVMTPSENTSFYKTAENFDCFKRNRKIFFILPYDKKEKMNVLIPVSMKLKPVYDTRQSIIRYESFTIAEFISYE